ncbi:MAG: hypothetical protein WD226_08905 [Planctomycetota bacterium]
MREANVPPWGLVLVRLAVGWIALSSAWHWAQDGLFDGRELTFVVRQALEGKGAISRWWGETVLLANPEAVLFLWKSMAFVTGFGFLFGALVRPIGAFAVLFLLNAAAFGPDGSERLALLLAVCCLGCASSHAGRGFGLDVLLDPTLPSWLTWTKGRRRTLF